MTNLGGHSELGLAVNMVLCSYTAILVSDTV